MRNLLAIALRGRERFLRVQAIPDKIRVRANDSDLVMFEQVFVAGDYDFDLGFQPVTIIDAGANVGYASLYFHQRYPEARILAIEPDPSNFETLVQNTHAIPQVRTVRGGLWSRRQTLSIADPSAPKCMISLQPSKTPDASSIEGYGVPDLMALVDTDMIDLFKIDIEGGELGLFTENAAAWIGKVRVFMIELHDRLHPGCAAAFYSALRGLRFTQLQKGDVVAIINEDLRKK